MIDKMIENMPAKTGKSLTEWMQLLNEKREPGARHKELVDMLMKDHNLGMNYADIVVHKLNGTDSGSMDSDELIERQYAGKENLRPIYDALMFHILSLGDDIEIAPKKAYVSLRRKKQFACLKPATRTRFELELILKGQEPKGILQLIPGAGAMCTHKINIETSDQVSREVLDWFELAYSKAI
ncbi:DUF5655 domain-containing protein [Dyadobacter sp. 50-39]|uniref:DUF5655 domain-containing protein n=1 Tax=Dyadobacter sp. 50-39 TaxID=1895756 RepID=UPI000A6066C6|nr:DUF5655 domain-containing protein [Dyadobacter sp. 50-39]